MTASYEMPNYQTSRIEEVRMGSPTEKQFQSSLENARFEVLPLRGAVEEADQLPESATVTITASPRKGMSATLDLAETLAANGHHAVPHLSARLIRDTTHLSAVLDRLGSAGIDEVFVVAGDATEPAGRFPDALSLLRAMADLGRLPGRIGITGYPESHTLIPDEVTVRAMAEKSRYAHYIVSQICFEPATTARWVEAVRARGITQPIYVGVPGVVDVTKLLRISLRIGLGDSMRFLRKQHGVVGKMLSRYSPSDVVDALAPYLDEAGGAADHGIAGWHLYTFNEVAQTLGWREAQLRQNEEVPA